MMQVELLIVAVTLAAVAHGEPPVIQIHNSPSQPYDNRVRINVEEILNRHNALSSAPEAPSISRDRNMARIKVTSNMPTRRFAIHPSADEPTDGPPPTFSAFDNPATALGFNNDDSTWAPENADKFSRVDVSVSGCERSPPEAFLSPTQVLGERVDHAALNHMRPIMDSDAIRKLRRILGDDYQPDWMSIVKPAENLPPPQGYPKVDPSMLKSLDALNFTLVARGGFPPAQLKPKEVNMIKNWFMQRASCPMEFIWENLGSTYFPQFIRRGICKSTTESCSWPPGMQCKLTGSRGITLLRWVCNNFHRRIRRNGPPYRRLRRQGKLTRRERRVRHVRRLIRKLSVSKNGLRCQWTPTSHVISDLCTCDCS